MSHLTPSAQCPVIVYDFGGVLTKPLLSGITSLAAEIDRSPGQLYAALDAPFGDTGLKPLEALEIANITEAEMVAELVARLDLSIEELLGDQHSFGAKWFHHLRVDDDTVAQASSLRAAGFTLGLLTNNVAEWRRYWTALIPMGLFSFVIDSSEVGIRKPDPLIYQQVTQHAEAEPREILIIDDTAKNIRVAAGLGFSTFLWGPDTALSCRELDRALGRARR